LGFTVAVGIIEACLPGCKIYFEISISLTGKQMVYYQSKI
jgi:hypothetical protein